MLRPLADAVKKSLEEATALYEAQLPDPLPPYLASRGISRSTAERFRLGLVGISSDGIHPGHEQYAGRLAIPYLGPNGVQGMRFRCLLDHDHDSAEVECPKFLGVMSVPTRLYNTRAIKDAGHRIYITEGEPDTWTVDQLGVPVVGVPGSNNWKPHHWRIFSGFSEVFVLGDNDDAGKAFVEKVCKTLTVARPIIIGSEPKDDATSFFIREGADALRSLLEVKG